MGFKSCVLSPQGPNGFPGDPGPPGEPGVNVSNVITGISSFTCHSSVYQRLVLPVGARWFAGAKRGQRRPWNSSKNRSYVKYLQLFFSLFL